MHTRNHTDERTHHERSTREARAFRPPDGLLRRVNRLFARKWHVVIVSHLLAGRRGFSELKDEIDGISGKMLSDGLTRLEADGVLERDVLREKPVRVEYSLTPAGRSLEPVIDELVTWAETHVDDPQPAFADTYSDARSAGDAGTEPSETRGERVPGSEPQA